MLSFQLALPFTRNRTSGNRLERIRDQLQEHFNTLYKDTPAARPVIKDVRSTPTIFYTKGKSQAGKKLEIIFEGDPHEYYKLGVDICAQIHTAAVDRLSPGQRLSLGDVIAPTNIHPANKTLQFPSLSHKNQ